MSITVAGATVGVGDFLGVDTGSAAQASQATGLDALTSDPAALLAEVGKNLQAHAVQVGVSTGMQVITGDMKWKEALQQGVINVAANTAGELAANEIGKLYDAGKGPIGYVEHKVRHIVVGSVEGLIMGHRDPLKGFISGGIAAGGAEIIAEGLPSTMSMQARKNVVLMTAGVGAFLLRGDVNVAAMAASNAFENNFAMSETLPALTPAIPVLEWLGLAGLGAAATVAASAMGLATGGFAGGNYLANQSEQNPALGEIWVDSDSYYGPVKSKLTPHESRPSILSTPGFEYDPIIFSTPLTERRSSVLATPVADFPVWKEGFTQWKGPIFQNVTPVADNMPNTTVLANSRHGSKNTSALEGFEVKKGDQPWTIRPGQEWKAKIYGKAQKTGTDGHRVRTYREAIALAKRDDVEVVALNRGVNRFLSKDEKIKPNTRPDAGFRTTDGKIHQIEVPSKTDVPKKLEQRMRDTNQRLPSEKHGEYDIKNINKGKK